MNQSVSKMTNVELVTEREELEKQWADSKEWMDDRMGEIDREISKRKEMNVWLSRRNNA